MVFLAWFGGTGYLLTHYYRFWFLLALVLSMITGLTASAIVFWFLAKVLLPHETRLDPADFEMVGTLATVTVSIHEGGTGEILFTQGGARHSAGARSEDGKFIIRGTEVVVTRYEKGIAYVQKWEEMV
jgi:membrane protein implicated in regulation of membrane protease activity